MLGARTERLQARRFVLAAAVRLPEELRREGLSREAAPIVMEQPEPLMGLCSGRSGVLRQERAAVARPAVPAGSRRGAEARRRAHLSAAAARRVRSLQVAAAMAAQRRAEPAVAQRLALPALQAAVAAAVQQAQAVPPVSAVQPTAVPGEVAAPDAEEALRRAAELAAGVARRPEEAAVPGAAEEARPQAAGPVAAEAVRLRGVPVVAPDAEEALRRAAEAEVRVLEAGARRRVARDEALGARLWAAAWAALPSTRCQGHRLAPSARAQSAHARGRLRTAQL